MKIVKNVKEEIMQILKITKNKDGVHSLSRVITVVGCIGLTFGFYRESLTNGLEYKDYIAYAVAMTIMYMPSKAIELIYAIRGNTPPMPPIPPTNLLETDVK